MKKARREGASHAKRRRDRISLLIGQIEYEAKRFERASAAFEQVAHSQSPWTQLALFNASLAWLQTGNYARFLPSVLAVMFSAWYGGLGPGLLATGLSALTAGYLTFSPADYPLSMAQPRDVVQLTMFCSIGVMISSLSGALRSEVAERRHAEQASKAQASR